MDSWYATQRLIGEFHPIIKQLTGLGRVERVVWE